MSARTSGKEVDAVVAPIVSYTSFQKMGAIDEDWIGSNSIEITPSA
jgi:hypothetical protein